MAKRKSDDDLEKVSLNLIRGDFAELQGYFKRRGAGYAIRKIVHGYLTWLRQTAVKPSDDTEFDAQAIEDLMREEPNGDAKGR